MTLVTLHDKNAPAPNNEVRVNAAQVVAARPHVKNGAVAGTDITLAGAGGAFTAAELPAAVAAALAAG